MSREIAEKWCHNTDINKKTASSGELGAIPIRVTTIGISEYYTINYYIYEISHNTTYKSKKN